MNRVRVRLAAVVDELAALEVVVSEDTLVVDEVRDSFDETAGILYGRKKRRKPTT